jgi:hypothetical protein
MTVALMLLIAATNLAPIIQQQNQAYAANFNILSSNREQQLFSVQKIGPMTIIGPTSYSSTFVLCDPGQVVTGGGFTSTPTGVHPPYFVKSLAEGNGWSVTAFNPSGSATSSIQAIVECAGLAPQ